MPLFFYVVHHVQSARLVLSSLLFLSEIKYDVHRFCCCCNNNHLKKTKNIYVAFYITKLSGNMIFTWLKADLNKCGLRHFLKAPVDLPSVIDTGGAFHGLGAAILKARSLLKPLTVCSTVYSQSAVPRSNVRTSVYFGA